MNKIEEIFTAWKISFNPDDAQADIAAKRIEICDVCEFKEMITLGPVDIFARCKVCGCALRAKIFTPVTHLDPGGSCPHGKWNTVEDEYLEKLGTNNVSKLINTTTQVTTIIKNYYSIHDNAQEYSSYDGIDFLDIGLPEPTESNNNLSHRINSSLVVNCGSTWSIRIKIDNTNLSNILVLATGQSATFIFDGIEWNYQN